MTETAHPLDALFPDPAGKVAFYDETRFAQILEGMVADEAPRLFAIIQEYGERLDGWIAAWGMAFEDRHEIIGVNGGSRMTASLETALHAYAWGNHIRTRLVWVDPDAVTPKES